MHLGFHAFGELAYSALAGELRFREQRKRAVSAKTRMHAGDEIDRLVYPQPCGKDGDVCNETGVLHQGGSITERLAPQHLELALVGGQAKDGAQCAGLAGTVWADETHDPTGLNREIRMIQCDVGAVFLRQISRFYQGWHRNSFLFRLAATGRRSRMGECGRLCEQLLGRKPKAMDDREDVWPLLVQESFTLPGEQLPAGAF